MPLESVLPLLPDTAVRSRASSESNACIRLPLKQILPQLSKGRVIVPLSDLLSQVPSEMLVPDGVHAGTERIALPLEQVVASLSPEVLHARTDQKELELEDADIPVPFAEEPSAPDLLVDQAPLLGESPAQEGDQAHLAERGGDAGTPSSGLAPEAEPVEEPMPQSRLFEPAAVRDFTPVDSTRGDQPQDSQPDDWRKQWVYIQLGDILDAIPGSVLAADRSQIRSRVDLTYKVPVAMEEVVPQLQAGKLTLEVEKIAGKLPEGILVDSPVGRITLGIQTVIEQLPESVFTGTGALADMGPEVSDIPTPFQEVRRAQESVAPVEAPEQSETAAEQAEAEAAPEPASSEAQIPDQLFTPTQPPIEEKPVTPEPEPVPVLDPVVEPVAEEHPVETPSVEEAAPVTREPEPTELVASSEPVTPVEPPLVAPAGTVTPADAPAAEQSLEPVTAAEDTPAPVQPEAQAPVEAEVGDLDSIAASSLADAPVPASESAPKAVSPEDVARALNDLNTWTMEELHRHTLGPTLTQRILEYRAQKGGFKDLRELLQIAGIGPRLFERVLGFRPEALEDQAHAINRMLGVTPDHEMSLQEIVKQASRLPGVEGCIVAMSDGLYMTGELPQQMDSQRVSAFAPQLFGRVSQYVQELNIGTTRRLTIFTDAQPITIFKADDLFFIVIHKANRFSKVLLNKCERISLEISRICSKETAKA